jgi:membrane protease YdiL (CAAX protease family)
MSSITESPENKGLRRIGLFLLLTLTLSSIFYAFIIATGHVGGGGGIYVIGLMWAPAIAALLTCRITGLSLQSLGWGWGAWKWQWLAYAVPLAYTAVAYAIIWLAGWGGFPDPKFISTMRTHLGWIGASDWVVLGGRFLLTASVGMVMSTATALGEEIGWRGFLAPHMTKVFGFRAGAIFTGIIWAAWHMPVLLFADYNAGTPWWVAMPCFTAMIIGDSVIMAWLRLRSGSLWAAAIFHASHNNFIQDFFTPATSAHGWITPYAIDEFGFAVPAVVLAFAIVFWQWAKNVEQPAENAASPA